MCGIPAAVCVDKPPPVGSGFPGAVAIAGVPVGTGGPPNAVSAANPAQTLTFMRKNFVI